MAGFALGDEDDAFVGEDPAPRGGDEFDEDEDDADRMAALRALAEEEVPAL